MAERGERENVGRKTVGCLRFSFSHFESGRRVQSSNLNL